MYKSRYRDAALTRRGTRLKDARRSNIKGPRAHVCRARGYRIDPREKILGRSDHTESRAFFPKCSAPEFSARASRSATRDPVRVEGDFLPGLRLVGAV